MDKPVRIQLKRTKGWRMPENTVKVDRTSKWGNPWRVEDYKKAGWSVRGEGGKNHAARVCVDAFRAWLEGREFWAHGHKLPERPDLEALRGKNLACWCKLDQPCHADVLLQLANKEPSNG